MKFLPSWMAYWISDAHFDAAVTRVVRAVEPAAWQLVAAQCGHMGRHEARGYVRARAALLVARHARREATGADHRRLVEAVNQALFDRIQNRLRESVSGAELRRVA